jgi:hypothetical protein
LDITKDIILEDNNKIINDQLQVANNFNNFFMNVAKDIGNDNNLSAEEHPSIKTGKMELFIDLFIKFVIGLTIAGFANFRSFAEMPSRPVAFFEFALFICFDTKSFSIS